MKVEKWWDYVAPCRPNEHFVAHIISSLTWLLSLLSWTHSVF